VRRETLERLRAPVTGNALELEVFEQSEDGARIEQARLIDREAGAWYRLEDGIAELLPSEYQDAERRAAFRARFQLDDAVPETGAREANAQPIEQIEFFGRHHDQYEEEVVKSPFYDAMDAVTLGRWLSGKALMDKALLEVGAGSGRQTLPLARSGARVLATDLSEEMLRLARRKVHAAGLLERVDFVVCLAEQLPVADDRFDAGLIFGSMHHFLDPEASLKEMGRALRSGAPFYLLEPHDSAVRPVFDWLMNRWTLWEEEAADDPLFNRDQFERWLGAAGFRTRVGYSTYLPPHLFYVFRGGLGRALLGGSDAVFSRIPGINKLAGVITAEAVKV
jgi:SAM-dependent methyltransferase/uncharacterized protein YbaR (Trm112 family)